MRNFRQLLLTSTLILGAGTIAAVPANAQDATQPTPETGNPEAGATGDVTANAGGQAAGETVVVTGSRIRRDEFSVAEPLTVITAEEITQSGFNSVTDALQ